MTEQDRPRFGGVDLVAVAFPEERIPDRVKEEIAAVVASGTVTLVDLVVVRRGNDGALTVIELEDLGDELDIDTIELPGGGLTGQEDIDEIAAGLPEGTSAIVLLFENTWARGFVQAANDADGVVLAHERIPGEVVNAVLDLAELDDDELAEVLDGAVDDSPQA
ncbi:DUF6325 family protein [Luteimicrobium subarcticum]|uniref:DUF1269 domain-containing protein n=1 Tax=Luteimicrobium subarcticum TaxID=620910 RepID=A0A2M8WT11_9MICO|nr:DUF6325 family protein [Luteimicrobium subarcticum]PJI94063.1 hypothetical protein CLV34_1548 [Luteimicrobium subarcticum]